ncbi:MAG TPA: tripartite tricarboxylate transporter substrate binding protein [Xanthobacteraceae bacterium]|nr:tripartite tricarboxylate transporter substrate binding protein [Xanthobacteraceae bacterium]
MRMRLLVFVFGMLALGNICANAQDYPTRTITIVVPFPPGGPTDTIARILADRMKAPLGQTVIVENIGGAGGAIGVGHVARSAPDGYTLSIGHVQTHVLNAATMKLDYDVVNDFAPVSLIADTPVWIVGRKTLPADDVKGLIAWLKSEDGKATSGTVGVGGPPDIAGTIFAKETGTKIQFVPYRGGALLLQDLLGAHIDMAFSQAANYVSYVHNGQLKAYAVLAPKRWWAAPEVPTLDELGIPAIHATFWHGIWVPKGTPADVIAKLNAAIRESLADPSVQERFRDAGQEVWAVEGQTPEALAAKQKDEIARWTPIIKEAGIKAE